ncbi:MAG: hypothetical protein AAFO03_27150 [Bacteroidota bacterium]
MSRFILLLCLGLFISVSSCSDDDDISITPTACTSLANDMQAVLDANTITSVSISFKSGGFASYDGTPSVTECALEINGRLFNLLQVISYPFWRQIYSS